jgi:hypothetical protein
MESAAVRNAGRVGSGVGDEVGVVGFDFDLPRKRSMKVGVEGFLDTVRPEGAKSDGEGFAWAGGKK